MSNPIYITATDKGLRVENAYNRAQVKELVQKGITHFELVPVKKEGTKTRQQEKAYHLWLTQVAEELDRHGHTIQNVVGAIKQAEIRPTGRNLKEVLWRPYQIAAVGKESTTRLNKAEVDRIYEGLNKFLGEHFEIHVPFPSDETRHLEENSGYRTSAGQTPKGVEYEEYTGPPTI